MIICLKKNEFLEKLISNNVHGFKSKLLLFKSNVSSKMIRKLSLKRFFATNFRLLSTASVAFPVQSSSVRITNEYTRVTPETDADLNS